MSLSELTPSDSSPFYTTRKKHDSKDIQISVDEKNKAKIPYLYFVESLFEDIVHDKDLILEPNRTRVFASEELSKIHLIWNINTISHITTTELTEDKSEVRQRLSRNHSKEGIADGNSTVYFDLECDETYVSVIQEGEDVYLKIHALPKTFKAKNVLDNPSEFYADLRRSLSNPIHSVDIYQSITFPSKVKASLVGTDVFVTQL